MDRDDAIAQARHDMDEDPYGTTMSGVKLLLRTGMARNGAMSDDEFANLKSIEEFVVAKDNAI